MNTFIRIIRRLIRYLKNPQKRVFTIVLICLVVLIIGWLILYFTKDNTPKTEAVEVKLTCHDSDGYDLHKKGSVTYTDAAGKHVDEDYCDLTEKGVNEMTCHKTSFWSFSSLPVKTSVACPNNRRCANGACQK